MAYKTRASRTPGTRRSERGPGPEGRHQTSAQPGPGGPCSEAAGVGKGWVSMGTGLSAGGAALLIQPGASINGYPGPCGSVMNATLDNHFCDLQVDCYAGKAECRASGALSRADRFPSPS